MANIIEVITARIEDYRKDNKNPCKNYATKEAAEKATSKMASIAANHFGHEEQADYIVFYIEAWGRWVGAINMTALLSKGGGGYIGICSSKGFYSF
ncbi:hypothetical protein PHOOPHIGHTERS_46 [Serratia phage vB_SmaS_PhooPhighters]|nr:hypothetical protein PHOOPHIGHTERS_46 [Serratia phage vB_SmaS_PhooPhighters]